MNEANWLKEVKVVIGSNVEDRVDSIRGSLYSKSLKWTVECTFFNMYAAALWVEGREYIQLSGEKGNLQSILL